MNTKKPIKVTYTSVDRYTRSQRFKTLEQAQRFAHRWVGEHPEIGRSYAISGDGIGKITVKGASLSDLFPEPVAAASFGGLVS